VFQTKEETPNNDESLVDLETGTSISLDTTEIVNLPLRPDSKLIIEPSILGMRYTLRNRLKSYILPEDTGWGKIEKELNAYLLKMYKEKYGEFNPDKHIPLGDGTPGIRIPIDLILELF